MGYILLGEEVVRDLRTGRNKKKQWNMCSVEDFYSYLYVHTYVYMYMYTHVQYVCVCVRTQ